MEQPATAAVAEGVVKEAEGGSDSGVEVNGGPAMGADTPAASCDSSLLSCCYSSEDLVSNTLQQLDDLSLSEGGSESSSLAGYQRASGTGRSGKSVVRTPSTHRPSPPPNGLAKARTPLSARDKTPSRSLHPSRALGDTPRSHRDHSETSRKTPRPSTKKNSPTDDGRWPSTVAQKPRPVAKKAATPTPTPVESKASALEKYATLPRRRRKSADNLTLSEPLSSREPSLNRSGSLRRKQNPMVSSATSSTLHACLDSPSSKSMPPYPRKSRTTKTRIYHETSVQTALTGADLENGVGATLLKDIHNRVETRNCGVQVERGLRRVEQLEGQLRESKAQLSRLAEERAELSKTCDQLRVQQLTRDAETIRLKSLIIGNYDADDTIGQLEQQVITTNSLLTQQQQEISTLQGICLSLQKELDKSFAVQKTLRGQQDEAEMESRELQEFLQAEKAALADTLRDLETELGEARLAVAAKEAELQRQKEECSHLVRISEQRRQEQLSLEARLAGMELRSREMLLQQGASVSGASVALSRLGSRLDHLVEALVTAYNISDTDLEDVIFHNEAYSHSQSESQSASGESSADASPEHQPAGGSGAGAAANFMAAVLNAIRSATTSRLTNTEPSSDAEPMLSSEPEPSAFGHRDVTTSSSPRDMDKRHSLASLGSLEVSPCDSGGRSESLHNLSLAILRRQQLEAEGPAPLSPAPVSLAVHSILDQVIDVDNSVTRLLKVIRIIQQTNDASAQLERKRLSDSLIVTEAQMVSGEQMISQLRLQVETLRDQLHINGQSDEVTQRLHEKENQLGKACLSKQLITDNWSQAMGEVRRQYQAIDSALEVLASVQGVVQQSPALVQLQKDLEERNFQCAANLPLAPTPDHNANGPVVNGHTPA